MITYICWFLAALTLAWAAGETAAPPPLRLHILANSDSPADQRAKLLVRDAVLPLMLSRAEGAKSREEAAARVMEEAGTLLAAADAALAENGCPYRARLSVGAYAFPARRLGRRLYPAGEYAAFRLVLGAGAGHNWWSVLFPPLCIGTGQDGKIEYERDGKIQWKSLLKERREGEEEDEKRDEQES